MNNSTGIAIPIGGVSVRDDVVRTAQGAVRVTTTAARRNINFLRSRVVRRTIFNRSARNGRSIRNDCASGRSFVHFVSKRETRRIAGCHARESTGNCAGLAFGRVTQ